MQLIRKKMAELINRGYVCDCDVIPACQLVIHHDNSGKITPLFIAVSFTLKQWKVSVSKNKTSNVSQANSQIFDSRKRQSLNSNHPNIRFASGFGQHYWKWSLTYLVFVWFLLCFEDFCSRFSVTFLVAHLHFAYMSILKLTYKAKQMHRFSPLILSYFYCLIWLLSIFCVFFTIVFRSYFLRLFKNW